VPARGLPAPIASTPISWGIHVLEFHGPAFALVLPEKIDFGSAVSAPEEDFLVSFSDAADQALEGKAFPGGAQLEVCQKLFSPADRKQRRKNARIGEIQFGPFHLTFANVGVPGLEQPKHERAFEKVDIFAGCHIRNSEIAGQFGIVNNLSVFLSIYFIGCR
jgi:hypothetical protein